jgi:hypothetical protein
MTAGVPIEIRTRHLRNASLEHNRYDGLLSHPSSIRLLLQYGSSSSLTSARWQCQQTGLRRSFFGDAEKSRPTTGREMWQCWMYLYLQLSSPLSRHTFISNMSQETVSRILEHVKCVHKVTANAKAWTVFSRSNTGATGSYPSQDMNVCVFILFLLSYA